MPRGASLFGAPEDGVVLDWPPFWFAHAANGAIVAVRTAAASDTPLFSFHGVLV